jgi:hypothetical protein
MGNFNSIDSRISLGVVNNMTQSSVATCEITCEQSMIGNTVIVSRNAAVGNINFTQDCTITNTECVMNQNIDTSVENILDASIDQTAFSASSLLGGINQTNLTSNIDQQITNQVQQLISTTCTIGVKQVMDGNYVYVGDAAKTGDINFVQKGDISNDSCILDVTSKITAYNKETGASTQKSTSVDFISLFFMLLGLVSILGALLVFVFLTLGGSKAISEAIVISAKNS